MDKKNTTRGIYGKILNIWNKIVVWRKKCICGEIFYTWIDIYYEEINCLSGVSV